jgi:head-tail adaptor
MADNVIAGLESGKLDRRIMVQRAIVTPDEANDPIPTWTYQFSRWAQKQDLSPVQTVGAGQVLRYCDTAWILRWDTQSKSIAPEDHRFIWQGVIYEIVGVAEITMGRMEGLRFLCSSRPDQRGERAPING